jgi:hypothetical protein
MIGTRIFFCAVATPPDVGLEGWYYRIDGEAPKGPFENAVDADREYRTELIFRAGGGPWPTRE